MANPATGVADADHGHSCSGYPPVLRAKAWRQTDGAVCSVVEGSGAVDIERRPTVDFQFGPIIS
jgi:gentisate 1,2-dioxygenase